MTSLKSLFIILRPLVMSSLKSLFIILRPLVMSSLKAILRLFFKEEGIFNVVCVLCANNMFLAPWQIVEI